MKRQYVQQGDDAFPGNGKQRGESEELRRPRQRSPWSALTWAMSYGDLRRAGVEGTGTYGAGLTRLLREHDIEVLEVNRPDRAARRLQGKSDPTALHALCCLARPRRFPKPRRG